MSDYILDKDYIYSIINAMGDMVRVIGKDGKIALTNEAFEKKYGNMVGEHCFCAFDRDCECDDCISRAVMQSGKMEKSIRQCKSKVYSISAYPIIKNNKNIAVVEIIRDVTLEHNIKESLLLQNSKMQKDLQLARKMQQSLVQVKLPEFNDIKLEFGFYPCEAVGGDIYDCIEYNENLIMYVADVSGHGVMPAMLSVFFSRLVKNACSLDIYTPAKILDFVQKEFLELDVSDEIYITAFIAVLNTKTYKLTYANAGLSVPPILYDGGKIREIYFPQKPVSKWFSDFTFEEKSFTLNKKSRLLIYSDGLQLYINDDNKILEYFSTEDFSGKKLMEIIKQNMNTKPKDDLTILVCERVGT